MGGKDTDIARQGRRDRLIREMDHDPYHSKKKHTEPTICPDCNAVFHEGRWQWGEAGAGAAESLCPACERIRDRVPAGFLTISGEFYGQHAEEIDNLIGNIEEKEKTEHPLERIMHKEEDGDDTVYTFTSPHLTRAAGEAIERAYDGELDFQYAPDEWMLRAHWKR